MPDVVDRATRSRMMSGIRGRNTRPEMYVRQGLHRMGFRYRLHVKEIPGRPDIVLPKHCALINVNGCFWHGHDCRYFKLPDTNRAFWLEKIKVNVARDQADLEAQKSLGWRVLVVWECAIRGAVKREGADELLRDIAGWLTSDSVVAVVDQRGLCVTGNPLSTSPVIR